MITKKEIKYEAVSFYKEWVEGEPLTQDVPIACYVEGAQYVLNKNKKNYKKALRHLDPIILGLSDEEWKLIVNALRITAGMSLIENKKKL